MTTDPAVRRFPTGRRFPAIRRFARRALAVALVAVATPPVVHASEACAPEAGGTHTVVRVIDGDTLALDDGGELRLFGALAPKSDGALAPKTAQSPSAGEAARALHDMVLDRPVTLRYGGRKRDRYGRALAQAYVQGPDGLIWVQEALVRQGLARAYALPGHDTCLRELVATEQDARRARRGLWSREVFRVREASEVQALLRLAGRFTLVQGRVSGVTRTQRTTYINFGPDWRRDFTASLATALVDKSDGAAALLSGLSGKAVRVRGWIERRNGPMIVLGSIGEIEVIENETAPR